MTAPRNPGRKGRPVVIRGVAYPSCAAADLSTMIDEEMLRRARAAGRDLDRHGAGTRVPTTLDGVTYESRAAAGRATGTDPRKLSGL